MKFSIYENGLPETERSIYFLVEKQPKTYCSYLLKCVYNLYTEYHKFSGENDHDGFLCTSDYIQIHTLF